MRFKRTLLIVFAFIISIFLVKGSDVQDSINENCHKSVPSDYIERIVQSYLDADYKLISLILHLNDSFKNDSIYKSWEQNTIEIKDTTNLFTKQTVDSIIVRLSNGLSWNIKEAPPKKPPKFWFKLLFKDVSSDSSFIEYAKYAEFCSQFDNSNKKPCLVTRVHTVYTTIKIDDVDTFNAKYVVDLFNEPKFKAICKQVVLIN